MDTKQRKYRDLIERVKASYPARNPSDDGKELRLYRCDDCKEINLWTYWQGKGNLDAKIMLVGQDWGCPWDDSSQPTMDEVRKANEGRAYDYLHNNPSPTDANLTQLFNELGYVDEVVSNPLCTIEKNVACSGLSFAPFVRNNHIAQTEKLTPSKAKSAHRSGDICSLN